MSAPAHPAPVRWRGRYAGVAAGLLAAAADAAADPARTHVPLCPLHAATGLYCPLCGGLRAVSALLRGHPAAALRDNALVLIAAPVLAAVWRLSSRAGASARAGTGLRRGVLVAATLLVLAFTVLRNLPLGAGLLSP